MTKTEMARQLAAAANEKHIERMAQQLEALRQSKARSVEELAQQLEPLAQAMAALTDETKHTLEAIEQRTRAQAKDFDTQSRAVLQHSKEARRSLEKASRTLGWRFLLLMIVIGVISGGLTSASLLWLLLPRFLPPVMLDTQAVAQSLLQHFPTQPPSPPAKPSGNSSTR
jgi:uncharacterized membrane protein YccC